MVATLRGDCEQTKGVGIPDDFLRTMVGGVVDCFRRLDGLGREDPFWEGTNRRPTTYKMGDFCRKLARDAPDDRHVLLMQVSVQVLVRHFFDPPTWERLAAEDRSSASQAVYAAFIGIQFGGYDTAPEVVRFLKDSGLCDEARPAIDALAKAEVAWVREWAETISDGCWGGTS